MNLFLAEIVTVTVYSPGDDGMSEPDQARFTRLVEAKDRAEAEAKVRAKYERNEPYSIRVEVDVSISEVIR